MPPRINSPAQAFPSAFPTSPAATASPTDSNSGSAAHVPPPPAASGRKRRSSGPSSRGVASLTPDQLAKKRANDREAQRAIRERTRNQIEGLERRIQELTAQQPYRELENALREKERAQAENEEIKRRLASVLRLIQPLLGSEGEAAVAAAAAGLAPSPPGPNAGPSSASEHGSGSNSSRIGFATPTTAGAPSPQGRQFTANSHAAAMPPMSTPSDGRPDAPSLHAASPHVSGQASHDFAGHSTPDRLAFGFAGEVSAEHSPRHPPPHAYYAPRGPSLDGPGLPTNSHITMCSPASRSPADPHPRTTPPNLQLHHPPLRHSPLAAHLDFTPYGPAPPLAPHPPPPPALPPSPLGPAAPLPLLPATCPLDGLLLEYLAQQRARAAAGTLSRRELWGPHYPTFAALLAPDPLRRAHIPCHRSSRLLADVIARFPDIAAPPEKAAVMHLMYLMQRWMCAALFPRARTASPRRGRRRRAGAVKLEVDDGAEEEPGDEADHEDDDPLAALPPWMRPTPLQRATLHPIWADHLPWPGMRDAITRHADRFFLEEFFVPYTTTLSLNWPHGDAAIWEPSPPRDGAGHGPHGGHARGGGAEEDGAEELVMSAAFEAHIMDLNNWSLGPAFVNQFPALAEGVRVETARR